MLRQEQYNNLCEQFQTNIGVAEFDEPFYGFHTNVSKMPDELKVIILTRAIVNENIYQQVIREVLRLEKKYKNKRINKSTIYEKAINNII
jgi:hypothetical protein